MRSRAEILELLEGLDRIGYIDGYVYDGGLLGVKAADEVIVYLRIDKERRFTWKELDAFLDGAAFADI